MSKTGYFLSAVFCLGALASCTGRDVGEGTNNLNSDDPKAGYVGTLPEPADRDDCKIEGSAIGSESFELVMGEVTVKFSDWVQKGDSPGDYVGFTITSSHDISYVVKAGGERHHSDGASWSHPGGTTGPDAPGISHIDFCENFDNFDDGSDGGNGGSDGGGSDECEQFDSGDCQNGGSDYDGGSDGGSGSGSGSDSTDDCIDCGGSGSSAGDEYFE